MKRWVIEVEVDDRGHVDATLFSYADRVIVGCPIHSHGDTTGSEPVLSLVSPLAGRVSALAEEARLAQRIKEERRV